MSYTQAARRTGRTTRMLDDAKRLTDDGHAVYIIAANGPQAMEFRRELSDRPEIKVECRPPEGFNWQTMRVVGAHPNCVFLVDHYAIENKFDTMLKMLHRYDS